MRIFYLLIVFIIYTPTGNANHANQEVMRHIGDWTVYRTKNPEEPIHCFAVYNNLESIRLTQDALKFFGVFSPELYVYGFNDEPKLLRFTLTSEKEQEIIIINKDDELFEQILEHTGVFRIRIEGRSMSSFDINISEIKKVHKALSFFGCTPLE